MRQINSESEPAIDLPNVGAEKETELESPTIHELVAQARTGCAAAFAEIHDRMYPRLIRFLQQRLARSDLPAEDVAQESLTQAWKSLHRYDPKYQFTTWLYTIAARKATDQLRSRRRTKHRQLRDDIPSPSPVAGAELEIAEMAGNLWAIAQRALTDDQYAALWLRFSEDLSVKEIASVLGKTSVGIRVLLHRGRHTLQAALLESGSTYAGELGDHDNRGAQR